MAMAPARRVAFLLPLALTLAAAEARAAFQGSFGINGNSPSANPTSALATATNFTFGNMSSNGNTSDGFAGLPSLTTFAATPLTLGAETGFSFSNATFGTFTQTAAAVQIAQGLDGEVVTSRTFRILGTFAGGPAGSSPLAAVLTLGFTQAGGPGSSISSSGTLDINPVPEPASLAMTLAGLAAAGVIGRRRIPG